MRVRRGEAGYLRYKKRKSLMGALLMTLIGFAVFVIGLLLNQMSNRNLFTIIAVLFVLPGAKFLVAYIVAFPYPVSSDRYQKVKEKVPEGAALYADLVITSPEKVMHLDFAVVGGGQVIAVLGNGKQEISYVRSYLTKGIHNWGSDYKVKIVDSEKIFLQEVMELSVKEVDEETEDKVKSYLLSLIV